MGDGRRYVGDDEKNGGLEEQEGSHVMEETR